MASECREKINSWLQATENVQKYAFIKTYQEIGDVLGMSASSVSLHLPSALADRHQKTIRWVKEKRRQAAHIHRRPHVKVSEKQQRQLKKLRKQDATYIECAAELGLHYQTIRKYCKLFNC